MKPEKKIDFLQFREKFIEEANDQLNSLDGLMMKLERNSTDQDVINQIFRVMHTLKGSSGMFGFTQITAITHDLENIYDSVRNGTRLIDDRIINLTFSVADHVRNLLTDFDHTKKENIENQALLLDEIKSYTQDEPIEIANHKKENNSTTPEGLKTYQILFNPDETIIQRAINLSITFHDLFKLGQYHIHAPSKHSQSANWAIFLITEVTPDDIEDALIFVMDYCKITKLADFDIFNEENLNGREQKLAELDEERRNKVLKTPQESNKSYTAGATIRVETNHVVAIKKGSSPKTMEWIKFII